MANIAVVGAGLAGVTAAHRLEKHGLAVTVFDRGRRVGGRCSSQGRDQIYDHGAQFLTLSNPEFELMIDTLRQSGAVAPWTGHFVRLQGGWEQHDEEPIRFVGVPHMRTIVETLACGLNVQHDNHVQRIETCARGWRLINHDGSDLGEYNALVLAMPPEQVRSLLPSASVIFSATNNIKSRPSWALMVEFKERLPLAYDSALIDHNTIAWAARDSSKPGRPAGERWVVHSSAAWAQAHLKTAPETVAFELYEAFLDATQLSNPAKVSAKAHRWRLGFPLTTALKDAYWDDEMSIGVCGDWCVSDNLQGAFLSGTLCGELVASAMGASAKKT
jgi:renalase